MSGYNTPVAGRVLEDLVRGDTAYVSVTALLVDPDWRMWIFRGVKIYPNDSLHGLQVSVTGDGLVCALPCNTKIRHSPSSEIKPETHIRVTYLQMGGSKYDQLPESLRLQVQS